MYSKLPSLILSPMGVASHTGVMQDGTFKTKDRVTHDLPFPGEVSRESINSRVLESALEPYMFSYVLLILVHYIVSLQSKYPASRIWLRKEDYKSSFCLKLERLSQPIALVLSPIHRMQSSFVAVDSMISSNTLTTYARYSNTLICALPCSDSGIIQRQALP